MRTDLDMGERAVVSSAQMRAMEAAAMVSGAVTGVELMERAGRGVVAAMFEARPTLAPAGWTRADWCEGRVFETPQSEPVRAVILAGPGNNGGDGYVIGRLLRGLGWRVDLYAVPSSKPLPPDAQVNADRFGPARGVHMLSEAGASEETPAVLIDALFGIGLSRPLPDLGPVPELWQAAPSGGAFRVAVDVPSGLNADTGEVVGGTLSSETLLPADLTVTFHRPKPGHRAGSASHLCGRVVVEDIGL